MRIVIDLQSAQGICANRGIGRYSLALTKELIRKSIEHEIYLILNTNYTKSIQNIRCIFQDLLPQNRIKVFDSLDKISGHHYKNIWKIKTSEKLRECFIATLSPDIVFIPSLFEGWADDLPTSIGEFHQTSLSVTSHYDLIPFIYSDRYIKNQPTPHHFYKKMQQLKRSDLLITLSNFAKQEVIDYLSIPSTRIVNCSVGLDSIFKKKNIHDQDRIELNRNYKITRNFIFNVGGIDFRKNIDSIINAFILLPSDLRIKLQLVIIVSVNESLTAQFQHYFNHKYKLNNDELILISYVSDAVLLLLYNLCSVFVFPSLHEGFGLPIIEAMACGAPTICSNVSSMPEAINCEAALFNPRKPSDIANKIVKVLTNEDFKNFLINHGAVQSKKFSWENTASKVLRAFEDLNNSKLNRTKLNRNINKKKIAYFLPVLSKNTTINYNFKLLPELACLYEIVLITNQTYLNDDWLNANFSIYNIDKFKKQACSFDIILYQFENSNEYWNSFELLKLYPGIVILHDFYLGKIFNDSSNSSVTENNILSHELYISHGYTALFYYKKNGKDATIKYYPCNLSIFRNSYGIIIHSLNNLVLANKYYKINDDKFIQMIKFHPLKIVFKKENTINRNFDSVKNNFSICIFISTISDTFDLNIYNILLNLLKNNEKNFYFTFIFEENDFEIQKVLKSIIKKNKLQNNVKIINSISLDTVETYSLAADVAIHVSNNFSNFDFILECLAAGIPTIVNTNVFLDKTTFRLIKEFTIVDLESAIDYLYHNPAYRSELSKNSKAYIKENYCIDNIAEEFQKKIIYFLNYNPNFLEEKLISKIVKDSHLEYEPKDILSTAECIASNRLGIGLSQILVDISYLVNKDAKTGIQRVVRGVLISLLQNPPSGYRIEPIYYDIQRSHYFYARNYVIKILGLANNLLEDSIVEAKQDDIFLGLDLCDQIIHSKSLLNDWDNRGIKFYFIIYDLLPLLMPNLFINPMPLVFLSWLKTLLEFADGVICISKSVVNDFLGYLKKIPSFSNEKIKIGYFHLGSDIEETLPSHGKLDDKMLLENMLTKICFISVGTIEPRKNHLQIINAFTELWENGFDVYLILIGKEGWNVEGLIGKIVNHSEFKKRLFWYKHTSDETLQKIYQHSTALVLASENEGFGLPLIEAARYNLYIIARNIPVFKEIAGKHAFYFEGSDPKNLAKSLKNWLELYSKNLAPKTEGMRCLTWKESTEMLLDVIIKENWLTTEIIPKTLPNLEE